MRSAPTTMMRILIVNDGLGEPGGVQSYLDAIMPVLEGRGHSLAIAYCTENGSRQISEIGNRCTRFRVAGPHANDAFSAIRHWAPDICYSHNMHDLDVECQLMSFSSVVKFMHGYFGTCISGQKMH